MDGKFYNGTFSNSFMIMTRIYYTYLVSARKQFTC